MLVGTDYTHHAHIAFGENGGQGIMELLDAIKLIYQHCPLEKFCGTLTVVLLPFDSKIVYFIS